MVLGMHVQSIQPPVSRHASQPQLYLGMAQVMGKSKVLVKVHPEGKYVVDLDKSIDAGKLTPGESCMPHALMRLPVTCMDAEGGRM